MDNYNSVSRSSATIRASSASVGTLKEEATAGRTKKASAVFNEGDVLSPKIANVRLMSTPPIPANRWPLSPEPKSLSSSAATKHRFINVQTATASRCVKIVLVQKQ